MGSLAKVILHFKEICRRGKKKMQHYRGEKGLQRIRFKAIVHREGITIPLTEPPIYYIRNIDILHGKKHKYKIRIKVAKRYNLTWQACK